MTTPLEPELGRRLRELDRVGLRRHQRLPAPGDVVFCSNDYLGLARDPVVMAALAAGAPLGAGSGASRLVSGTTAQHVELEDALARWLGAEACLLFSSGYAANVGLMSALLTDDDAVFSDALNHASLIDGMRLGRGQRHVYPHRDLSALRAQLAACDAPGLRIVITESVFSMDGDRPDLDGLCDVAAAHGASVFVDEAHALGVCGPGGRGVVAALGLVDGVAARVGTFGKSLGSAGAFVAGSQALREWLYNRARSFVFSTAPSPAACAAVLAALGVVATGVRQDALWQRIERMAARLSEVGLWRGAPASAIFPVRVGDAGKAVALAAELGRHGYFVQAIRPPTVPAGTARLRVTVSATHELGQIDAFVSTVAGVLDALGIPRTPSSHD